MKRYARLGHLVAVSVMMGALGACSGESSVPTQGDGAVVVAEKTPPALSGGTLLVTQRVKNRAVVSDPDRDLIWVVDLAAGTPIASITLEDNDEPGRLIEDAAGLVHVALRRGGALVTVDPSSGSLIDGSGARTPVCAAPRGMAYDGATDAIHVACMNGELVTVPAAGGAPTRTLHLDRDLRDVIIRGDDLLVTTFRSANVIRVGADGKVKSHIAPPVISRRGIRQHHTVETYSPEVAWRTVAMPSGELAMLHQRALDSTLVVRENPSGSAYGGGADGDTPGCDPTIVHSTISTIDPASGASGQSPAIPHALMPIDLATHQTAEGRTELVFVAASSNRVFHIDAAVVGTTPGGAEGPPPCTDDDSAPSTPVAGEPVAVAFWGDLTVVQTRDPVTVSVLGNGSEPIVLPGASTADTGHDMFHRNDAGEVEVSCSSCHPEGRDDGHVWRFNTGARRTQNIANDVMTSAPFHWDGDMKDLGMIMHEVFEKRMGGVAKGPAHTDAFQSYMSTFPPMANPVTGDPDSIARGQELFNSEAVGCSGCHGGPKFSNNENKNVGTGRAFQVPSLVGVAMRAPYMHTGCAATLKDRFDPSCGGNNTGPNNHGNTKDLTDAQIDDLVAFLESI